MPARPALILASTSRYRADLLRRLNLPFSVETPNVEEAAGAQENAHDLAMRLAREKCAAVAARHPAAIVIGSDQVADLDGAAIGKPLTHERAVQQLRAMSGRDVIFHTAVCVSHSQAHFQRTLMSSVTVSFRDLSDAEIENYLLAEKPYDCAGSAKCETSGIALLRAIISDDPTALVGLPLIHTCELLRQAGLDPLIAARAGC